MQGTLIATYKGKIKRCRVYGEDSLSLTIAAICKIMNKAQDSTIWAKGEILLKDLKGNILKRMPEKE